ncbi:MAG: SRPBCC family protein [Propioniciclava sp.]
MAPYSISRSIRIASPPDVVRQHLVDFRAWQDWSPWEGLDPNLQRTYSGPESGPGAHYAWQGNKKAGAGSMEMLHATAETIEVQLIFTSPWKATNLVVLTLQAVDHQTEVTWTMHGENKGIAALFAKVMNMDAMLGKDFEKGLRQLKNVVEQG